MFKTCQTEGENGPLFVSSVQLDAMCLSSRAFVSQGLSYSYENTSKT